MRHRIGRYTCNGEGIVKKPYDGEMEWDTCDECYEQRPRCHCGSVASKTWAGHPVCDACIDKAWPRKGQR